MAFRRRGIARRRGFKRFGRRPLARVRRTWITSMNNTMCNPLEVPLAEPCEAGSQKARVVLVDNTALEEQFSDSAVVKRIVGDLWLIPTWFKPDGQTCGQSFAAALEFFGQAFVGLKKDQQNNAGDTVAWAPLDNDYDYSEAEWLRTWQHMWWPMSELNHVDAFTSRNCAAYICPDVHTSGALSNDFVDGTGTIEISTDCGDPSTLTCEAQQDPQCNQSVRYPQPWHIHLDLKKSIRMRENEELALDFDFRFPAAGIATLYDSPNVGIVAAIKCLLQY